MPLNRDAILKANDLPLEVVEVPEWGGSVCVRGMTGAERSRFEQSVTKIQGKNVTVNLDNVPARIAVMCTVDEAGERLFTDNDLAELGAKSASALNRIMEVAMRLSGLSNAEIEAIAKN
jgi:hypothetical protein